MVPSRSGILIQAKDDAHTARVYCVMVSFVLPWIIAVRVDKCWSSCQQWTTLILIETAGYIDWARANNIQLGIIIPGMANTWYRFLMIGLHDIRKVVDCLENFNSEVCRPILPVDEHQICTGNYTGSLAGY